MCGVEERERGEILTLDFETMVLALVWLIIILTLYIEWRKERKDIGVLEVISRIVWIATGLLGFIIFAKFLGDINRDLFGEEAGNQVIYIEAAVLFSIYVGFRFWKKGKKKGVIACSCILGSLLFGYIGWFFEPKQIYKRAFDKHENASIMVEFGLEEDDPPEIKDFWQMELKARELEKKAAELRYLHHEISRSHSYDFLKWIFPILLFLSGIALFLEISKEARKLDVDESSDDEDVIKVCPYCSENIYYDADRCPYCEKKLNLLEDGE